MKKYIHLLNALCLELPLESGMQALHVPDDQLINPHKPVRSIPSLANSSATTGEARAGATGPACPDRSSLCHCVGTSHAPTLPGPLSGPGFYRCQLASFRWSDNDDGGITAITAAVAVAVVVALPLNSCKTRV